MQASQVYYAATLERYESRIKRPYFHVKPLDTAQLGVWSRYTEHVRATGTRGDGIRVYERCLVPCAAYPGVSVGEVLYCVLSEVVYCVLSEVVYCVQVWVLYCVQVWLRCCTVCRVVMCMHTSITRSIIVTTVHTHHLSHPTPSHTPSYTPNTIMHTHTHNTHYTQYSTHYTQYYHHHTHTKHPTDFWMSYVSFLQAPNTDEDTQAARAALQRGLIHCINKPELLLFAARWEEQHGGVDAARAHYRMLLDVALVSDQQLLEV